MSDTPAHPAVVKLMAPVDAAQKALRTHVSETETWVGEVNASPHLSDEGRRDFIARELDSNLLPMLERLRAVEAAAIQQAEATAAKAASEPRHSPSDPRNEKTRAALETLGNLPAAVLTATLRQAVKDKDADTERAVKEIALQRATHGRQWKEDRADSMSINEETWGPANLMERAFGEGAVFEPESNESPAQTEALLANWRLLGEVAALDEAKLPEDHQALRALFATKGHERRALDFRTSRLAGVVPTGRLHLLTGGALGRPGR